MGTARPRAGPDRNETVLLDPGAKEPQLLFSKFLKRCYQKERLWEGQAEDPHKVREEPGDPKCPVSERGDSLLLLSLPRTWDKASKQTYDLKQGQITPFIFLPTNSTTDRP